MKRVGLVVLALPVALAGLAAQGFEMGKMWTFEYPPDRYFSTTYGFTADSAWFTRARLAALRLPAVRRRSSRPMGLWSRTTIAPAKASAP